jgi:hypothetical protein
MNLGLLQFMRHNLLFIRNFTSLTIMPKLIKMMAHSSYAKIKYQNFKTINHTNYKIPI